MEPVPWDGKMRILLPLTGALAALLFTLLPEPICANWGIPIGVAIAIVVGSTIGSFVACGRSGLLPGIFGAGFWGALVPCLVWLPLAVVVFPVLAVILGRQRMDSIFSVITICRINVVSSAIGMVIGGFLGGRIATSNRSRKKLKAD